MPRILIIDTLYPDFISSTQVDTTGVYEIELKKVLDRKFGTFDAYSRNLRAIGWEAFDWIYNHEPLRKLAPRSMDMDVIGYYQPDVVFVQDLSLPIPCGNYLLVGQHSCPWAGDDNIKKYDIIFTSFPHYVPRIEKLGVRAVYVPLAFEPSVLCYDIAGFPIEHDRDLDCVFIGGVGNPSHWKAGMQVLETVAREIPTFKWWGYGVDTLPKDSALRPKYQGQAWGREMYDILMRSKLCLNRHGEVAQGYANNMRIYEATGCGSMLLCDGAWNIGNWFLGDECEMYKFHEDAVTKIRYYLSHDHERRIIAANGQRRTLSDHTYAQRMVIVSDVLKEALVRA